MVTRAALLDAARVLVERLTKATAREPWQDIHDAADKAVPQWIAAYLATVEATRQGIDTAALGKALEAGDVKAAVAAVQWETMDAELARQYYRQITDLALSGAKVAARDLALSVDWVETSTGAGGAGSVPLRTTPPAGGSGNFDLRFDLTNPKSFDAISAHTADLVREVSDETKAAIKGLVDNAFREGVPPAKLGRQIREHIGLTFKQSTAVGNYRRFLTELAARDDLSGLAAGPQARMARGLRSARSVPPIMRQGLTEAKIDTMATAYRDRLLRERAENIARTETINAANSGQRLLWEEGVAQGQIDTARMRQKWLVTPDDRLCFRCSQMKGEFAFAEIGEPFVAPDGTTVDQPPLHPRCRCSTRLVRKEAA